MLKINNLHVKVEDKEILKGLNLKINKGEIHVIMGPNGAGKSTLANSLLNNPEYKITEGTIEFEGERIENLKTDEIARKGIFMTFQTPEEIPGISVMNFLRFAKSKYTGETINTFGFRDEILNNMKELGIDNSYSSRSLNVGFSGGEKKKNEILQMLSLNPKLAILDELDSGLDVDAIKAVAKGIKMYKNDENALLIITHSTKLLEELDVDYVHILVDGKIVETSGAALYEKIDKEGYGIYEN